MEDLQVVESVVRKDPKVIEQCGIVGIPPEDMHKVYCDRRFQSQRLRHTATDMPQPGPLDMTSDLAATSVFSKH